ncbi:MAG: hypothetical protein HRU20_03855 [Pseudomonadales bacterium]|nr:hypothetical protein [Pseudomonadales bacterium]
MADVIQQQPLTQQWLNSWQLQVTYIPLLDNTNTPQKMMAWLESDKQYSRSSSMR